MQTEMGWRYGANTSEMQEYIEIRWSGYVSLGAVVRTADKEDEGGAWLYVSSRA